MSNFEPYEVSKAKWLVAEVMSDDSFRSLPSDYLDRVSSKVIDKLIEGGVTIPEDFRRG